MYIGIGVLAKPNLMIWGQGYTNTIGELRFTKAAQTAAILGPIQKPFGKPIGNLSHLGVSLEAASGLASSQIPQAQSLIP